MSRLLQAVVQGRRAGRSSPGRSIGPTLLATHRRGPAHLLLWAALLAPTLGSGRAFAETIAFTGGTVHTASGPVLENATVVVEDGRITAVGPSVQAPAGARIVPCAGKHVYPGLIAANTCLGLTEIGSVLGTNDWQETGNINANIRAEVEINPESDILPVTRINGVTTALTIPQGDGLTGTSALIHLDGWTWEDMTLAAPVGLHIQWPSMSISRGWWETRSEEEQKKARDEQIRAIRDAFADARAYWKAREAEGKAGIPRHDRDVKWDAMRRALRGEIPVMFHARSLAQIRAALRFADDEKLTRIVLVGGDDAGMIADELKKRDIAIIARGTLELPRRSYEAYDTGMSLPQRLEKAGLKYCITDGGGASGAANARNLPYHAAMAAAFGLSRDEALRAITLYPAQILGVADRLGSIEPGKIADLVIADGDPLEITTHVEQVWIAGKPISMETRQTRLFHKYDERPKPAKRAGQPAAMETRPGGGVTGGAAAVRRREK